LFPDGSAIGEVSARAAGGAGKVLIPQPVVTASTTARPGAVGTSRP
jgi:hypothetical protein